MSISDAPVQIDAPSAPPASPAGPTIGERPSRARWWLVILLPAVAILTAVLWLYLDMTAVGAAKDQFSRTSVPGELTLDVHPDTWYVYLEGAATPRAAVVKVTDSNGRALTVTPYFPSGWYDAGGKEGRAVAKFNVRPGEMGTVTVGVSGNVGDDSSITFAVGNFNVHDFERLQRWGIGGLFLVNFGSAIAIALAPAVRRRRRPRH